MAGKSKRPKLVLTPEQVQRLERLRGSRTAPVREGQRAEILWRYHGGETIAEIMRAVKMTRKSVGKWIGRALAMGPEAALKDAYHRPREPRISEEAKAWVVHLACSQPKQLGLRRRAVDPRCARRHVRRNAVEAGYPALAQAAKATVHRILAEQPLHPEKVTYYLQRRDPDFESKMRLLLLVYREVALQNESPREGGPSADVITVSVDEKPGVQAIANTAPDCRRSGAASLYGSGSRIPTSGNLLDSGRRWTCTTGRVTARVERRHRSREFILLLKDLDQSYPAKCTIRLILDNHSSHISKETKAYLATRPKPLPIRAHAHPRVLAQHCGDLVWEDGAHFLKAYPRRVLGGTPRTNPAGDRGKQRRSGDSPLEQVRGARGSA